MLLYRLLKYPARVAIFIYCRNIRINFPQHFKDNGPLLIAMNHPNSFLDAIILTTLFKHPVYALARGDVFKKKWASFLLKQLNIFPVYRRTEGVENLSSNYLTFSNCKSVFRKKGIVLIFSEGRCINEWKLRPLGKGTARLAISSWEDGIPVQILPVGINYQSFKSFGKNVVINFGIPISSTVINGTGNFGQAVNNFNKELNKQLQKLVLHSSPGNREFQSYFTVSIPLWQKILLAPFAIAGYILHAPLYLPLKIIALKRAAPFEHFDSVLTGALLLLYPAYLLIFFIITAIACNFFLALVIFILFPFTAWSFVKLKNQQ